ncbi:probable G-protein coupled receptor 141 [Varanus komodoensis]|uniref:G protein-coupled receptor 141 n=1 Tax=Varanus komodoensis TaxID=61221 RepID=A0A8D2J7M8_VARKO|nr:probable G-protein coupled receptor 141 [Varanus komodoensis]
MATENETLNMTSGLHSLTDHHNTGNAFLIITYTIVFIGGVTGAITMSFLLLKMNTLSVTTTAIINLVVIHSLFLITVPFRLYYYSTDKWIFGFFFCRFVSIMVHLHMYLTFLFYVIVLVIRGLIFFQWKDKVEFYRNLHAVATSTAVWILALLTIVPVMLLWYGQSGDYHDSKCFTFQQEFKMDSVKAVNYTIIAVVLIITLILLGLQTFIVLKVVRKVSGSVWSHQEFRAQLKSMCFVCVIIFCFLPHHIFRIYYIQYVNNKQYSESHIYNEICLSITSISCLDLFSFGIFGNKLLRQKICSCSCC